MYICKAGLESYGSMGICNTTMTHVSCMEGVGDLRKKKCTDSAPFSPDLRIRMVVLVGMGRRVRNRVTHVI